MKRTIYHGSDKIIKKPIYGKGNKYNDYGLGFYCTEDIQLGMEWAVNNSSNGFCNKYELDMTGLTLLNLGNGDYNILNWLAILLENRIFRVNYPMAEKNREYIINNFSIEYQSYDVLQGYRADDSYFSFARAFINNEINLEQLSEALMLGDLGQQIVLKSEKAFKQIAFVESNLAGRDIFLPQKVSRDNKARESYRKSLSSSEDGIFAIDIVRQGWGDDHESIQRIVY